MSQLNTKILKILEFDRVKAILFSFLVTDQGKKELQQLHPVNDEATIVNWLAETEDAMNVLRLQGGIPVPKLADISSHMKRIEIGADLNGLELAQISRLLTTTSEVDRFLAGMKDDAVEFYRLYDWQEKLTVLPVLRKRLKEALDEDGYVRDEASEELKNIRRNIMKSEQTIRDSLDTIIHGNQARYLSDALITMRNERYVIPVRSENRNVFGGVVHDQSSSGQTLFIEPRQVVELNNRLRQYQIAERDEISRILSELSAELVPYRHDILNNAYVIGKMDFMNAKARLAKNLKAVVPQVDKKNEVYFKQARHPLLDQDKVVANDILIGADYQAVVITGPNTGGKTITLKTLGLLQLMAQAGLPIPAAEDSRMGIFDEVFADIGDEQSIEQNLSTFSSHMTNIVSLLEKVDDRSLVLLDELGAGTDPQEGAALAIAILDELGTKQSYVMATTHYPELKVYGYNRAKTINASMEFNVDTLSPTFHLLIGVPGRSNAFEISQRLGLASNVIDSAKQIMNGESQDLNEMITDLENRRKMAETEYQELRHYEEQAENLHHELDEAYRYFYEERENEITKARQKANKIVRHAQQEAEKIITDIRHMQQQSGQTTIKENELIKAKSQLNQLEQPEENLKKNKVLRKAKKEKAFKAGDEVLVVPYNQRGELLEKMGKRQWQVQIGILKMSIAEEDMQPIAPAKEEAPKRHISTLRSSGAHVASQLDLRGRHFEDALAELDQYLDAAILAGYPQVTIVHGKGTGALRQGVVDYLKGHRSVKSFAFAPANQGGNGATIVKFK